VSKFPSEVIVMSYLIDRTYIRKLSVARVEVSKCRLVDRIVVRPELQLEA
jgi:hypothetical protein